MKLMQEVESLRNLISTTSSTSTEPAPSFPQIDSIEAYEKFQSDMKNKEFQACVVRNFFMTFTTLKNDFLNLH
jgi:hypothetical protein